jgi:hypothetical protein
MAIALIEPDSHADNDQRVYQCLQRHSVVTVSEMSDLNAVGRDPQSHPMMYLLAHGYYPDVHWSACIVTIGAVIWSAANNNDIDLGPPNA